MPASSETLLIAIGGRLAEACEAFGSDLRIKVEASGLYTYPDVSIVCGPAAYSDPRKDTMLNPPVLIEVLSRSTESYDRGRKFQHDQTIATLQEYILVAQDEMRVERLTRSGDTWTRRTYAGRDAALRIDRSTWKSRCLRSMRGSSLKKKPRNSSGRWPEEPDACAAEHERREAFASLKPHHAVKRILIKGELCELASC